MSKYDHSNMRLLYLWLGREGILWCILLAPAKQAKQRLVAHGGADGTTGYIFILY